MTKFIFAVWILLLLNRIDDKLAGIVNLLRPAPVAHTESLK